MKTNFYICAGLSCVLLAGSALVLARKQEPQTVKAPGASLQLVARQFEFTEGPAADQAGNVFFTDQPNNTIWKYDTAGQLSVFLRPAGRANGLYFDRQGNLLACADEHNELWSINPSGKVTVLIKNFHGQRLNGPNDLWVHPRTGGVYFTDPYYQRSYWARAAPDLPAQNVYYLPPGAIEAVLVADGLQKPNGIVGTPDGRTLYVADAEAKRTYRYRIGADGRLQARQLFVDQGSDGLTLDEAGNVYLTGAGVTVYDATGRLLERIAVPAPWTANVTFGGPDRRTLFITASDAVFTLRMRVRGAQ